MATPQNNYIRQIAQLPVTKQNDDDLRKLGAVKYDLMLPETHVLPTIIGEGEVITGIIYGRYKTITDHRVGRGALVATNQRILLIDKKPLFINCDEISYNVVSGITYTKAGISGTVILHTRLGDIHIRTFNQKSTYYFMNAVENNLFKGNTWQTTYEA